MWERMSKYRTATRSEATPRICSWHFVMELKQHIVEDRCGSEGRRVRDRSSIADLAVMFQMAEEKELFDNRRKRRH